MKIQTFSALVLSLPSKDKTVRMRIWRALRGMGCGVLRDGVYLLPAGAGFANLESDVKAAGVDPLQQFLAHGIAEGRHAFADGHFG